MLIFRKIPKSPSLLSTICHRFLTTDALTPTSASYDRLIDTAGRERDFATVHTLLNKRVADGCFNTNKTFNFISTDLSLLDDLLKTLASLDIGFTRKGAYDSLIARLSKMQRTDVAMRVAEEMIGGGHGANALTFHPILNALTRKKMFEEAWRVMDVMRENEITPDVASFNFILTAHCVTGDLSAAAGVLNRITEEGMVDARTYDALVLGACASGKVDGALGILRRMVDDGVSALYATYAHVIGSLVRMGYYAQAVQFVMVFGGRDKVVDRENFGLLASRLIESEKLDEAKYILEQMVKRDLPMGNKLKDFHKLHVNS